MDLKKKLLELPYGIFDLDGTIVNSRPLVKTYMQAAAFVFGVSRNLEAYTNKGLIIKPGIRKLGRKLSLGSLITKLNHATSRLGLNVEAHPGVLEFIEEFTNTGGVIFVSTDSTQFTAVNRLQNTCIFKQVEKVYSSADGNKRLHVDKIARYLDITTEELAKQSFFASDGPRDVLLCQQLKFSQCIALTNTLSQKHLKKIANHKTKTIDGFQDI